MSNNIKTVAMCGAGGTGKGTLLKQLSEETYFDLILSPVQYIGKMLAPCSSNYSDMDFQTKVVMQYSGLMSQISMERNSKINYTDCFVERSVFDYLPYMKDALTKKYQKDTYRINSEYEKYKSIVKEYIKTEKPYTKVVFVPIEFEPNDKLESKWKERDLSTRQKTETELRNILNEFKAYIDVTTISGTTKERARQVLDAINYNEIISR